MSGLKNQVSEQIYIIDPFILKFLYAYVQKKSS